MAPPTPWAPACQVQHQRRRGDAAHQRRDREDAEADGEHHAAAEHVAEHAGGEEEGRQGERVGVDHPLEVAEGRVQGVLDVGEGDVHHRDVEEEHEGGGANGDEGPPLALECWHGGARLSRITIRGVAYLIIGRRVKVCASCHCRAHRTGRTTDARRHPLRQLHLAGGTRDAGPDAGGHGPRRRGRRRVGVHPHGPLVPDGDDGDLRTTPCSRATRPWGSWPDRPTP